MGVIYKLKDEVVVFIINERQGNPLASCRQLAESASQKFGLSLSKSSVHDVLKESGIITPRGRKPKARFEIPQDKKKQIQDSLTQLKLLPDPVVELNLKPPEVIADQVTDNEESLATSLPVKDDAEISPEYEGAGKIFLKAALWDLGVFSEEGIKETDWGYYLTYSKGIKVVLENNGFFFIDFIAPIERCIKEVADGLINNINPFIADKVSDETLFKACMDGQADSKMKTISIVGHSDHVLSEFSDIMECKRTFIIKNRIFVENSDDNLTRRSKLIFFSQDTDNNEFIDKILNLKGFDTTSRDERVVTFLIEGSYENKTILQKAADKLNEMYLRDEKNRLVKVKIQG